jgi:hypothetical protein
MASSASSADGDSHVLWINAGLSCNGGSVALTAVMQPSVRHIALGALPGLPEVHFHMDEPPGSILSTRFDAFFDRIGTHSTATVPA